KVNICNSTKYEIKLLPYQYGIIDSSKIKNIQTESCNEIEYLTQRGKAKIPIYFFDYFRNVDSIIVIWNNQYEVVHMINDSFISGNKYIAFLDEKNLGNGKAYQKIKLKETKHTIVWDVVYTFTEEDYNFAKD